MTVAEKYVLTMSRETAVIVEKACEMYARLMCGQFDSFPFDVMVARDAIRDSDFPDRVAAARHAMEQARKVIFPELPYPGQNYGVGHFYDVDTAWNAYQVLRYCRAWHEHPEGNSASVMFDKPMRFSDTPMPLCEVKEIE